MTGPGTGDDGGGPTGAPAARLEVVGGGEPDAAELAALTVALTPARRAPTPATRTVPAWARAALLEAVGRGRAVSATDLALLEGRGRRGG